MISYFRKLALDLPIRRKTLEQTGAAIADRALLGIATFLTGVILGRTGNPTEFGAYSLGMTIVVLAIALQESLISAPYTVNVRVASIGPVRFLGGAFLQLLMLAAAMSAALIAAALLDTAGGWGSTAVLAALVLVVPCVLVREFARRIDYAELQPSSAVLMSGSVAVLQLAMTLGLWAVGWLNAVTCLVAVGAASLGGGLSWYASARKRMHCDRHSAREAFAINWPIGRWIFATQVSEIVRIQAFPWLIAALIDTRSAGLYGACMAVSTLASPLLMALSNIMVPQIVDAEARGGYGAVSTYVRRATTWMLLCMGSYVAALCVVSQWVVPWLYGASYGGTQHALVVLALGQLFLALNMPATRALTVLKKPHQVFWLQLVSFVATLLLSWPIVASWGIVGAAYALLVGAVIKCVSTHFYYLRMISSGAHSEDQTRITEERSTENDDESQAADEWGLSHEDETDNVGVAGLPLTSVGSGSEGSS